MKASKFAWFIIQDRNNMAVLADTKVSFSRDNSVIGEAEDVFENLYHSSEAHSPRAPERYDLI